jgi:hypothetical protein
MAITKMVTDHRSVNDSWMTSQVSGIPSLWRMMVFLEINRAWEVAAWNHETPSTLSPKKVRIYTYIYVFGSI